MQKADFPEFTALWNATAELYNSKQKPSDVAVTMAFRALFRYDLKDVKRALDAHINDAADGRFMPKPADLVRHIVGDPESRCLVAWTKVQDTLERVGPYESIIFDDPAIMLTIEDLGGWIQLCQVTDKELPFKRNEFVTRYRGYINRPPERYPAKLIGMTEAKNAQLQGSIPDPVLIGDSQKCLQVHQNGGTKQRGPIRLSQLLGEPKSQQAATERLPAPEPKETDFDSSLDRLRSIVKGQRGED